MGKYLVTGAAGFIGSALAKKLIDGGHEVITIDNLSTGYRTNIPDRVVFVEGDCQDQQIIDSLRDEKFEAIFHIAGQSSGEISFDDPVYDLQTNTQSTLQLLQLCRQTECKKMIYASSMSVYGKVPDKPINEMHAARPQSFYGVGKLASEHYLRIFRQFGIATASLRLWNTYGPGQNLSNLRQGMASIFLAQALQNRKIHIKGSAERFRDFVYIEDVVSSFLSAEKAIQPGNYYEWNVCSGIKTKVGELVNLLIERLEGKIEAAYEGNTPGDQFGIFGDSKKFREETGWSPKYTLEEGMDIMIKWAKDQLQDS